MPGWKNTQGHGLYSRLTPQKVLRTCERSIKFISGSSLGNENETSRQMDGLAGACADGGPHRHASDRRLHFLLALNLADQISACSPRAAGTGLLTVKGTKMKRIDYVRMAEKCMREADRLPPGPDRDNSGKS
jgi:hypothetical protein